MNGQEHIYLYALAKIKGIGDVALTKILLKYGSAEPVFTLEFEPKFPWEKEIFQIISLAERDKYLEQAELISTKLEQLGGHAITIIDDNYPLGLLQLTKAPPILYVLGDLQVTDIYSVSIVGTRKASSAGKKSARKLARALAADGLTIISGLALGIDTEAHKGAIEANGRTIAVIGSGLDYRYPPENSDLWDELLANDGAIVSQFPPGSEPKRWHFPQRNWTMSGMSQGTIVVEASESSGAKLQAKYTAEQGRELFLTRMQVEKFSWAKTIADENRATIVTHIDDVIDLLKRGDEISTIPDDIVVVNSMI